MPHVPAKQQPLTTLLAFIGAQRHGSAARRAAFVCWMCVPVYLLFSFWALGGWFLAVDDPSLDGRVLSYTTLYGFTLTLAWIAAGVHGIQLDHLRRPDDRYVNFVLACYATSTALTCYLVGTLNIICGLVMMGAPLLGMMLFPMRRILVVFALTISVVLGASVASAAGFLPYAPVLSAGLATTSSPGLYYAMSGIVGSALYVTYEVAIMMALVTAQKPAFAAGLAQAIVDPLTGLANRAHILAALDYQLDGARTRANRDANRLGLVLVSIDDFRALNGQHGFVIGDRALVAVAHALRNCLRNSDLIGRYNGSGFLIVLPDAGSEVTREVAERCRQAVASAVVVATDTPVRLTASLGVTAASMQELPDAVALMRRVEAALATARREGRDRVATC